MWSLKVALTRDPSAALTLPSPLSLIGIFLHLFLSHHIPQHMLLPLSWVLCLPLLPAHSHYRPFSQVFALFLYLLFDQYPVLNLYPQLRLFSCSQLLTGNLPNLLLPPLASGAVAGR